jgi:hypothetical protein
MSKEVVEHKDKLGRVLKLGDAVCYPYHNGLELGTVKKLNPKMVKVWEVGSHGKWYTGTNKYPNDLVVVEGPEVTMYLLKMNTAK